MSLTIEVGKTYFDTDHYPCTIVSVKEGFRDINIYIDEDGYEYTETGKILNENYDPDNTVQGDLIEEEAAKGTLPDVEPAKISLEIGKTYLTSFNKKVCIVSRNRDQNFNADDGTTYTSTGVRLYTLEDEALVKAGNARIVREITSGQFDIVSEQPSFGDEKPSFVVDESRFTWGDVIETFTYNFDGISTDIVKYHPYESANGGASLGCKGNQNKVMFYNGFVRESNESLLYIILLFLTQHQLGQNHRSLAKGLCKALDIDMKPVP